MPTPDVTKIAEGPTLRELIERRSLPNGLDTVVLGTLPVTADGVIAYDEVWWIEPETGDFIRTHRPHRARGGELLKGGLMRFGRDRWEVTVPYDRPYKCVPVGECFSTPEAAEASKAGDICRVCGSPPTQSCDDFAAAQAASGERPHPSQSGEKA